MSFREDRPRRTPVISGVTPTDSGDSPGDRSTDGEKISTGPKIDEHHASAYTLRAFREGGWPVSGSVSPPVAAVVVELDPGYQVPARLVEPESGSVIAFRRQFYPDGPVYDYAAIRTVRGWYVTHHDRTFSWAELVAWVDQAETSAPATLWLGANWVQVGESDED